MTNPLGATETTLTPASRGAAPWLIALCALGLVALAWLAYERWTTPDEGDPVGTMVVAFQKQNRLTVFSAQVVAVVSSSDEKLFGLLTADQTAIIPARVDYHIDLSRMSRRQFDWDAQRQEMRVVLPPVIIGRPNLDERRARYFRKGLLITNNAQERLNRGNTSAAERSALGEARNPYLLALARDAAKQAVAQNLIIPLHAAGYADARVVVRFADEGSSS